MLGISFISARATIAGWSATSPMSRYIFSARNITRSPTVRIPPPNTLNDAKRSLFIHVRASQSFDIRLRPKTAPQSDRPTTDLREHESVGRDSVEARSPSLL